MALPVSAAWIALVLFVSSVSLVQSGRAMASELLRVKKLSALAILPSRGSRFSAGYDLSSAYNIVVPSRGKAIVKTDLAIAIPPNTYARIAPRSGLAAKNFIDVGAGVVDYDYRGNVGVVLFNHAEEDFAIKRGDRVAQLILERICMADMEEVQELPDSERAASGFGSTGVTTAFVNESAAKKPRLENEEHPAIGN